MYAQSQRGRRGSIVVGIGGISGSGKSTIALALAQRAREYGYSSDCVSIDDFFVPRERAAMLPADARQALAASPHACIREKTHDTNSPAAIAWPAFLAEISRRREGPGAPDFLFVEGFLVFCREGSEQLAAGTSVYDAAVFVSVAKEVAMERKRARSYPHVSRQDFCLYFDVVTYPNYAKYGSWRPSGVPIVPFRNDDPALSPRGIDELLRKLLPVVICVGDLHGWLDRATSLFNNLRESLPALQFNTADVVFLGDYVDRGPQSKQTLEWLIDTLPRDFPRQRHFFLAGNHEIALMAALGDLPPPSGGFAPWSGTSASGEKVWDGAGSEKIHWQGRRYVSRSSGDIYDSTSTMFSYDIDCRGIVRAQGDNSPAALQQELQKKIPQSHRDFLIACDWIIEFPARGTWLPQLTFVHAGLTVGSPLSTQLASLRAKDCSETKIPQLSGRSDVLQTPPEIVASNGMLISGHHGFLHVDVTKHRAIIDESGGCVGQRLGAMLLPASSIQGEPLCVYSGDFPSRKASFWNLDAMWEAAYSFARLDASIDVVLNVRDLAAAGKISKEQMRQWVNRQNASSGYTLLHQIARQNRYDELEATFVDMGADLNIKTRSEETAKEVNMRKKLQKEL